MMTAGPFGPRSAPMEVNMAARIAVTAAMAGAAKWSARSRRHCGHRAVGDHPDRTGRRSCGPDAAGDSEGVPRTAAAPTASHPSARRRRSFRTASDLNGLREHRKQLAFCWSETIVMDALRRTN